MLAGARFAGGIYWGAINNFWQGQIPYEHHCVGCLRANHFSTGRARNLVREGKGERRGREGAPSAQLPELQEDIKHNDPGGKGTVRSSDVGTSQDFLFICLFRRCSGCSPPFIAVIFFVRHRSNNAGADTMGQMFPSPRPGDPSVLLSNSSRTIKKILQLLWGWGEAGRQRENSLSAHGQL